MERQEQQRPTGEDLGEAEKQVVDRVATVDGPDQIGLAAVTASRRSRDQLLPAIDLGQQLPVGHGVAAEPQGLSPRVGNDAESVELPQHPGRWRNGPWRQR
jgi:hypothetical protein